MAFPQASVTAATTVALLFVGALFCPAAPLRVLDSHEVDLGPRSITYNRVATPVLKPTPVPTPAIVTPEAPPTAAELEEIRRLESKRHAFAFLSCTVYDHEFTEVEWYEDGQWVSFLTTIDFHYLSQLSDFETADSLYSFFMGLGDCSREDFEGRGKRSLGRIRPDFTLGLGRSVYCSGSSRRGSRRGRSRRKAPHPRK